MKKPALVILAVFLCILIAAEMGLRFAGVRPPVSAKATNLQILPSNFFSFDSLLGFKMNPGKYHLKQFSAEYDITINSSGHRIVSLSDTNTGNNKPSIIFLGGPSTFGHGVNDDETYPFFMQAKLPGYEIKNLAQLNTGLAENYVQLVSLKNLKKDDIVVYVYHYRHDDRAKQLVKKFNDVGAGLGSLVKQFSYITLDSNLIFHLHSYKQLSFPLNRYSALMYYLQESYNARLNYSEGTHEIAERAIRSMAQICKNKGCKFILVYWRNDEYLENTIAFCKKNEITAIHFPAHISFTHIGDHVPIKNSNIAFADSLINHLHIEGMLGHEIDK